MIQTPERQHIAEVSTKSSINVAIYVAGVILLAIATIAGVIAVLITRPDATDNATYIAVLCSITGPSAVALLALISSENHKQMNSRLDQMVVSTAYAARVEGVAEGTAERRAVPRTDTDSIVAAVLAALNAHPVLGAPAVPVAPAAVQQVEIVNSDPVPVDDVNTKPKETR